MQCPHAVNAQNVESVADLDAIRDAIWLPPRGTRRPGGAGNAWVPDFKAATWRQAVEDYFIVIPMIESSTGLANCAAIAAHEIVTYLDVGPYDLCLSMGVDYYTAIAKPHVGQPATATLAGAVAQVREAAEGAGKTLLGAHGDPVEMAEQGYHLLMVGEPTSLLKEALAKKNADAKAAVVGGSVGGSAATSRRPRL